jgi:hypothetical protein
MPKAKLVTRSASTSSVSTDSIPKNAGLTNAELDSNFLNLRDAGWTLRADDSTQHTITADTQINFSGGTITTDANGDITVSNLGGSGSTSQSVFTSFQVQSTGATGTDLGNFLRVNNNQIDFNQQGNAFNTGAKFSIYGSDAQGSGATDNIPFEVVLTDKATVRINEMKFPESDGSNGQVIKTNGSGVLSFVDNDSVGSFTSQSVTSVPSGSVAAGGGNHDVRFITTNGGQTGLTIGQPGLNSTERMTYFVRNNGTNGTLTVSFSGDTYTSGTMTVGQGKVRMFNAYAMQDDPGDRRIFVEASQSDVTYP